MAALVLLLCVPFAWSQGQVQVTGKVIDNAGEPLIGVSILEKGTTNGVVTDLDGNYSLSVGQGATLVFSYVGYVTQEKAVTGGTLNVTLQEDVETLDEVVVIGYGTVKAKNFTGSVDAVNLGNSPVANLSLTSSADLLRGRLSGVIMGAESGEVGTSSSIMIRGKKSINSTSEEPLIILNGVIFSGELNDIDPTTIESVSVLKDATSLAAYGSKAAQGVIMVTTKKGKEGKPQISFSTSHQFSTPTYRPKYLSGKEYIVYRNVKNGNPDLTDTSFMTPFELENYNKGKETDWYDIATRTGYTQTYNASISGAGERFNYYVSVGHSDMKGMTVGNHFARNAMNMNTSSKITDWLEVGANINFTNTINDEIPANLFFTKLTPYGEPFLPDGSARKFPDGKDNMMSNPVWNTGAERNNRRTNLNLGGHISIDIPWVEGLNFRVNGSYSRIDVNNKSFYHESYYPTIVANDWDGVGYTGSYLSLVDANGTIASSQTIDWVMDYILSYSHQFGDHYVSASLVYTRNSSEAIGQSYTGTNFTNAGNTLKGWYGLGDAGSQTITNPTYTLHNDVGYLARLIWSYKDTYHLNGSLRRDGSSVFGADNKWGYFPAFGAAWTISNEPFMASAKNWMDNLKLKLSWGKNGAQTLAPYGTLTNMTLAQGGGMAFYATDGSIRWGQTIGSLGNASLGWQATSSWNAGFEADFFNRRLHFEANYYHSKTTDQIFDRNIPVMGAGVTTQKATMGQVNNQGVEINATSVNIKNNDFQWNTDFNFTLNRNKLVELYGNGQDDLTNSYFIGKSLGAIYGYEVSHIDPGTGTPLYIAADGTETANPSPNDRKILGYTLENFRINLANTFTYKNWQLYIMLTGVFGGNGYGMGDNTFAYQTYFTGTCFSAFDIPFWTPENQSTEYPSPAFANSGDYYHVYNSYGHVRLQDLSLSYNITPLVSKWGIKNAKISLSGRNLFYIAPHWKMGDPENRDTSVISMRVSMPRAFTVALNLSF